MPIITSSSYRGVPMLFNGHLETVIPSMFRKIKGVTYTRERITLDDGDFLDLDWLKGDHRKLVIISHGLEGSSERHYVKGMARYFHQYGWDALGWNCRSCSGEMNRAARLYHHAATDDLAVVVEHAQRQGYTQMALVGFSMGGSLTLKYLGEQGRHLHPTIQAAAVFSVPCHLAASAAALDAPNMAFYRKRFLKKLGIKIQLKSLQYPDLVRYDGFENIQFFREFDERYTAPLHGFLSASDFYERASAMHYLPDIGIPTLVVNALNDPFLPEACHPRMIAKNHQHLYLETPARGGHVGFSFFKREENWMEYRALEFISQQLNNP